MANYTRTLHSKAREQSKEYSYNQDKEDAFVRGAVWAVEQFEFSIRGHGHYDSMMDKGTKDYLNKLSLADVRKFVAEMNDLKKSEES